MATQDELKQQVAKAAVEYVKGGIIGMVLKFLTSIA